jgi:hypothetical protein
MTITTVTIEKLCLQEESYFEGQRQGRLALIEAAMDSRNYDFLDKEFAFIGAEPIPTNDRPQLWCETCKFHQLRLSGFNLEEALERMVGVAHA